MSTNHRAAACLLTAIGCGAIGKPFAQMTAREHLEAAARENALADQAFEKVTGEYIEAPEIFPGEVYDFTYEGYGVPFGAYPYGFYPYEIDDPEAYIAWPRVRDPSEKYEDAASEHREKALQHERAAAALEGRPSPMPLPPPQPPLIPPDQT